MTSFLISNFDPVLIEAGEVGGGKGGDDREIFSKDALLNYLQKYSVK